MSTKQYINLNNKKINETAFDRLNFTDKTNDIPKDKNDNLVKKIIGELTNIDFSNTTFNGKIKLNNKNVICLDKFDGKKYRIGILKNKWLEIKINIIEIYKLICKITIKYVVEYNNTNTYDDIIEKIINIDNSLLKHPNTCKNTNIESLKNKNICFTQFIEINNIISDLVNVFYSNELNDLFKSNDIIVTPIYEYDLDVGTQEEINTYKQIKKLLKIYYEAKKNYLLDGGDYYDSSLIVTITLLNFYNLIKNDSYIFTYKKGQNKVLLRTEPLILDCGSYIIKDVPYFYWQYN